MKDKWKFVSMKHGVLSATTTQTYWMPLYVDSWDTQTMVSKFLFSVNQEINDIKVLLIDMQLVHIQEFKSAAHFLKEIKHIII